MEQVEDVTASAILVGGGGGQIRLTYLVYFEKWKIFRSANQIWQSKKTQKLLQEG